MTPKRCVGVGCRRKKRFSLVVLMEFSLTKEQGDIAEAVREFVARELSPLDMEKLESSHEFPWALYGKAGELGFLGTHFCTWDKDFCGSMLENIVVIENLSRHPVGLTLTLGFIPGESVFVNGTERQIKEYLRPVFEGRETFAILATESSGGSSLVNMETTASLNPQGKWVIHGTKQFITNGTISHYGAVMCRDGSSGDPAASVMLIADLRQPQIKTEDMKGKLILPTSPTSEVTLDDALAEDILLGPGKGLECMIRFLDESRVNIAAQAVGVAQAAYEEALRYARQRAIGDDLIIDLEQKRHDLAEMRIHTESARQLTYYAARLIDEGNKEGAVSSMAKYYAASVAEQVSLGARKFFGGSGHFSDYLIALLERDARVLATYEGTEEAQLEWIAREYGRKEPHFQRFRVQHVVDRDLENHGKATRIRWISSCRLFNKMVASARDGGLLREQGVSYALARAETELLASALLIKHASAAGNQGLKEMASYKVHETFLKIIQEAEGVVGQASKKMLTRIAEGCVG
jgi:acyl-CoA dehydrogenase